MNSVELSDPEFARLSCSVPPQGWNFDEDMKMDTGDIRLGFEHSMSFHDDRALQTTKKCSEVLKMGVNLFRYSTCETLYSHHCVDFLIRLSEPGKYLVDFQLLDGNMYEFLYQFGDIRRELKIWTSEWLPP